MSLFLELFWSFVQVGAFSIGGGYAAMRPGRRFSGGDSGHTHLGE